MSVINLINGGCVSAFSYIWDRQRRRRPLENNRFLQTKSVMMIAQLKRTCEETVGGSLEEKEEASKKKRDRIDCCCEWWCDEGDRRVYD